MKTMIYGAILMLGLLSAAWAAGMAPKQSEAGINYIVGGVGIDERKMLNEDFAGYTLRVEVAEKEGPYLADVHLTVRDDKGAEYLHVMMDGPILLADLPAGRYELEAIYADRKQQRKISINKTRQTKTTFLW